MAAETPNRRATSAVSSPSCRARAIKRARSIGPHAQACDVLDQKLLNLHILGKAVVDYDRRDLIDPQQAAG